MWPLAFDVFLVLVFISVWSLTLWWFFTVTFFHRGEDAFDFPYFGKNYACVSDWLRMQVLTFQFVFSFSPCSEWCWSRHGNDGYCLSARWWACQFLGCGRWSPGAPGHRGIQHHFQWPQGKLDVRPKVLLYSKLRRVYFTSGCQHFQKFVYLNHGCDVKKVLLASHIVLAFIQLCWETRRKFWWICTSSMCQATTMLDTKYFVCTGSPEKLRGLRELVSGVLVPRFCLMLFIDL